MSFSKKILTVAILSIIISAFLVPILVSAQTTAVAEPPFECWPKKDCKGNWFRGNLTTKSCGPFEKQSGELGFCYVVQPNIDLKIAFGEKSVVKGLDDYIGSIYNYLLAIVSIVAIVMVMVGGLRYLTAAGNPSAITSAKETILGAIVGLFLTLGSYTLLQTINPALVNLKLPDIKMIRTSTISDTDMCAGKQGSVKLGQQCDNTCDCEQGKCIPIQAGTLETFVKDVGYGINAALSIWSLGEIGAKNIMVFIKEGSKAAGGIAKFVVKNPAISAVTGYTLYNLPSGESGQPGICIIEADKNVTAGGWCQKDEHCVSGKCIINEKLSSLSTIEGAKGFGVCGSGGVGGACECAQAGVCADSGGCNTGLSCVDNSNGQYTKSCTDGKAESPCYSNNDCKVSGYECKLTAADTKRCMPAGSIGISTPCNSDVVCKTAGMWLCIKGFCSDGQTNGANCCMAGECMEDYAEYATMNCTGDSPTCSFYGSTDKQWLPMTDDANKYKGYAAYTDWQSAFNETTGRLTQCKNP